MPSEIRYIVFRDAEVVQAIQSYMRRMNQPLPTGSILGCGPEQDSSHGPPRFRITLAPDLINREKLGTTQRHDVIVEGSSLAAALIMHCRTVHVPLPAKAQKSLRLADGQLCLVAAFPRKEGAADLRRLGL